MKGVKGQAAKDSYIKSLSGIMVIIKADRHSGTYKEHVMSMVS